MLGSLYLYHPANGLVKGAKMTRQLERVREEKQQKVDAAVLMALEGGLVDAVGHSGGDLQGFGVKLSGGDCLITIKAIVAGRPQIAFVGSDSMVNCLIKVVREARSDQLRWRDDQYAAPAT